MDYMVFVILPLLALLFTAGRRAIRAQGEQRARAQREARRRREAFERDIALIVERARQRQDRRSPEPVVDLRTPAEEPRSARH